MHKDRLRQIKRSLRRLIRKIRTKLFMGSRVLVLGDSHVGVFEYISDNDLLSPHLLRTVMVTGATAYGLTKQDTSTHSYEIFASAIDRYKPVDVIVYMLGEVDCNVLYWLKAASQNQLPNNWISVGVMGVQKLVLEGKKLQPNARHVICGAHVPTVPDEMAGLQEHPLRRQVIATLYARTQLVLDFNQELKQLSFELGCHYEDITEEVLDPLTKLVRSEFTVKGALDHHLNDAAVANFWVNRLLPYVVQKAK